MKMVRLIGLAIGAYCLEYVLTAFRISTWVTWDFWWIGRFFVNLAVGLGGIWLALELVIKGEAGARQAVLGGCVLVFFGLEMFWRSPLGFILDGELPAFEPPLLAVAMLTARYLVVGATIFLGINTLRTRRFPPLSTGLFLMIFSSYMIFYNGFHFTGMTGDLIDFLAGFHGRLDLLLSPKALRWTCFYASWTIFWGLMTLFGFLGVLIGARLARIRQMAEFVPEVPQPKYKDPRMWTIIALAAYGIAESSFGFIALIDEIVFPPISWRWILTVLGQLLLGIALLIIARILRQAYKLEMRARMQRQINWKK